MEDAGKPIKLMQIVTWPPFFQLPRRTFQNVSWFPFFQLKRAFPGALIMVTIGFLVAYFIETSGGDQQWIDFVILQTNISCAVKIFLIALIPLKVKVILNEHVPAKRIKEKLCPVMIQWFQLTHSQLTVDNPQALLTRKTCFSSQEDLMTTTTFSHRVKYSQQPAAAPLPPCQPRGLTTPPSSLLENSQWSPPVEA